MQSASRIVGVLFLAASSVYAGQAAGVTSQAPVAGVQAPVSGVQAPVAGAPTVFAPTDSGTDPTTRPAPTTMPGDSSENAPIVVEPAKPAAAGEGASVKEGQVVVSDSGTVEIHVVEANLLEVLRMLSAQSQKNIITSKEVRGTVTANLYDVTIKEALDAVLKLNGYVYRERGNFIYVYSAKEVADMDAATRRLQTEVFRVFNTPAADAVNMVKPVLSDKGQIAFTAAGKATLASGMEGGDGGNSHAADEMLVITDYPDNLDRVRSVLKELDRRPEQILIEATILRASLTENNALGVDFNLLAGAKFDGIITNGAGRLEGPLDSSATNGGAESGSRGTGGIGTGNTFTNSVNGFKVGYVNQNVSVILAALEGITDTTVMANPKILALNRQQGEVFVGSEFGYKTTTVTASSSTETVEQLKTGTRLIFRPFISSDGFIRMEIHPEDSDGFVDDKGLPNKKTTEVTTNIMVRDGHTVMIGGLFREAATTTKNQIPLLGNIPIAGALFRNQVDNTQREEVIVLLTPHIIKDEGDYSKESEKTKKDWEKLRVGVRKGMMGFGRNRMAESEYEKAQAELAKPSPDRSKALWHLDAATNLNPQFLEAIQLKEQLTGIELKEADNSTIRRFVRNRITAEEGIPPTSRPASFRLKSEVRDNSAALMTADMPSSREFASDRKPSTQPAQPTQPTETISAPATQPSSPASESVSAPATQPSETTTSAAPTTQPADTVAAPATPATQPSASIEEEP